MSWYKLPSAYAQKMARLSSKIFNEYYKPPAPPEVFLNPLPGDLGKFDAKHIQNERTIKRHSDLPKDLDPDINPKYYPAHPQLRSLTYTLRSYGLFRDEHLDFIMEMKRIRALRGKPSRVRGGTGGKRAAIRDSN